MFEQLQIKFDGEWGGEAPTTWAQREQWQVQIATAPYDARLNPRFKIPLRSGVTLSLLQLALAGLVERNEALRTNYPVVDMNPVQRIMRNGVFAVEIWPEADSGDISENVLRELGSRSFELETEWPFRFGVVLDGSGHAKWLIGVISHVSADEAAISMLCAELEEYLYGDPSDLDWRTLQPREQASFELSDEGSEVLARSLREWRTGLEGFDALPLEKVTGREGSRTFPSVTLFAPGYGRWTSHLAQSLNVRQSAVCVAAASAAIAKTLSVDAYPLKVSCSNRRPINAGYVGMLAQQGLVPLRLGTHSFEELAQQIGKGMIGTYRSSRYDPDALRAQHSGQFGWYGSENPVIDHWINFMPSRHAPAAGYMPAELNDGQYEIDESGSVDYTVLKFGYVVSPVGDDLSLRIFGDGSCLTRETMRQMLEQNMLLLQQAIDSNARSGILAS